MTAEGTSICDVMLLYSSVIPHITEQPIVISTITFYKACRPHITIMAHSAGRRVGG